MQLGGQHGHVLKCIEKLSHGQSAGGAVAALNTSGRIRTVTEWENQLWVVSKVSSIGGPVVQVCVLVN